MKEAEWRVSKDPRAMMRHLLRTDKEGIYRQSPLVSERKLWLFVCAVERGHALRRETTGKEWIRAKCNVMERWVNCECTKEDVLRTIYPDASAQEIRRGIDEDQLGTVARTASWTLSMTHDQPEFYAAVLHDIVGNPFWITAMPWQERLLGFDKPYYGPDGSEPKSCLGKQTSYPWLTWNDGTVLKLAEAVWSNRQELKCDVCDGAKSATEHLAGEMRGSVCRWCGDEGIVHDGVFDPGRMAVLADALEDAGCADIEVLQHCRGMELCPQVKCTGGSKGKEYQFKNHRCKTCKGQGWIRQRGPHVPGCWVIDLLLRNEEIYAEEVRHQQRLRRGPRK